jgi:hypothetical protein
VGGQLTADPVTSLLIAIEDAMFREKNGVGRGEMQEPAAATDEALVLQVQFRRAKKYKADNDVLEVWPEL